MADVGGGGSGAAKVVSEGGSVEAVVLVPEVDLTGGKGGPAYVVQRVGQGEGCAIWTDVARVIVPVRSKRRTIIAAAVRAGGLLPTSTSSATVRVLDADAAREHPVGQRPRDPELVIG